MPGGPGGDPGTGHPPRLPDVQGQRRLTFDRDEAGPGLLIPRCSSVHTFGMRFPLDLYFLDERGAVLAVRRQTPPRRVAFCRGAGAVLEISSGEGGEFSSLCP